MHQPNYPIPCLPSSTSFHVALIELFRLSIIFLCGFFIVISLLICSLISLYRSYRGNENREIPFTNRLKVSYVQLSTLGYASIAMFCIQSVDCIEIEGSYYLYNQAEVECFHQHWQIVVLVFIFIWVVPYPAVLYLGCRWLRSNDIAPNEFLTILSFPPTIFVFLVKKLYRGRTLNEWSDQMKTQQQNILNFLNEPFFESETKDGGRERTIWEPVLITRRLILIIVTTFIRSPVTKLYPAGFFLIIFIVHDYLMKPFVDKILNFIQSIAMSLLVCLVLMNTFWALSINVDILESEEYKILGQILLILELLILLLPALVFLGGLLVKLLRYLDKICLRRLD